MVFFTRGGKMSRCDFAEHTPMTLVLWGYKGDGLSLVIRRIWYFNTSVYCWRSFCTESCRFDCNVASIKSIGLPIDVGVKCFKPGMAEYKAITAQISDIEPQLDSTVFSCDP